jgi:antitoxin MazE
VPRVPDVNASGLYRRRSPPMRAPRPDRNSKGLQVPKPILEQCGFGSEAEQLVEPGRLVVLLATAPRAGREESFASGGDGPLLPDGLRSRFDKQEWSW